MPGAAHSQCPQCFSAVMRISYGCRRKRKNYCMRWLPEISIIMCGSTKRQRIMAWPIFADAIHSSSRGRFYHAGAIMLTLIRARRRRRCRKANTRWASCYLLMVLILKACLACRPEYERELTLLFIASVGFPNERCILAVIDDDAAFTSPMLRLADKVR